MNEYYNVVFSTSNGKQRKMTIGNADFELTPSAISTALNKIRMANIFVTGSYGNMSGVKEAHKVTETKTVIM